MMHGGDFELRQKVRAFLKALDKYRNFPNDENRIEMGRQEEELKKAIE